jgi:hypothetical protein
VGESFPAPTFGHATEAFVIAHAAPGAWSAGTAVKYRQTLVGAQPANQTHRHFYGRGSLGSDPAGGSGTSLPTARPRPRSASRGVVRADRRSNRPR